jgi:hypothetical protein
MNGKFNLKKNAYESLQKHLPNPFDDQHPRSANAKFLKKPNLEKIHVFFESK